MKLFLLKFCAAIFTFVLGMTYTVISARSFASPIICRPYYYYTRLTLCVVAQNPERYEGKVIRMKGTLYSYSTGFFHFNSKECYDSSDAWATVKFDQPIAKIIFNHESLREIQSFNSPTEYKTVEAVIIGKFEDLKRNCFGPRYTLEAREIVPLSSVLTEKLPD
jgi:hypothetical protein